MTAVWGAPLEAGGAGGLPAAGGGARSAFWHSSLVGNLGLCTLFLVMSISFYLKGDVKEVAQPAFYDLLLVPMIAISFIFGLRLPKGIAWPMLFWGVLLAGYGLGSFHALDPAAARDFILVMVYLILTFVFFASLVFADPHRHLAILWNGYLFAATIAASIGVGAYLGLIPNAEFFMRYDRPTATFNDPNVFGPYLIAPILFVLHRLTVTRKLWDVLFIPVLGLLLLAVFLSFSRGAWANLIVSVGLFVYFMMSHGHTKQQTNRLLFLLIVAVGLTICVIAWALSDPDIAAHFLLRFSLIQSYDVEENGRFWTQAQALRMGMENPLGIGPAQWGEYFSTDPHNVYLSIFVAGGYLSVTAWIGLLVLTVVRGVRAMRSSFPGRAYLMIGLSVTIAHALEAVIIDVDNWRHLFFLLGSCWGGILVADRFAGNERQAENVRARGISSASQINGFA